MSSDIVKSIPLIAISSSVLIFLMFLITVFFEVNVLVTFMYVIPITTVSSTGMVVIHRQQVANDKRNSILQRIPKKVLEKYDWTSKQTKQVKTKEHRVQPKPLNAAKAKPLSPKVGQLTSEELAELQKTELEVDVQEQKFTCIVHKGAIKGNLYLCPHCKSLYCKKCANALEEKGDKCWACEKDFTFAKKITPELQKSINNQNALVNHYKLRLQTLDHRYRAKQMDKLQYYEQKEDLSEKMDRHLTALNRLKASLQKDD